MDDFERCRPWIEAALEEGGGTHSIDDIRDAVASHKMTLMAGQHSALLLELISYPQFKALRVFGVGGDKHKALDELQQFALQIPGIAKELGCHRYEGGGRSGWLRRLKIAGMKSHVFMFKDI